MHFDLVQANLKCLIEEAAAFRGADAIDGLYSSGRTRSNSLAESGTRKSMTET